MSIFITVLLTVLIFGFLMITHELGHYITARIFGVHVLEFSIGIGPKLVSVKSKKSGIRYSLRLIPVAAYVSMVGENGEDGLNEAEIKKYGEKTDAAVTEGGGRTAQPVDDPNALSKKPIWQRMIIIAAGGLTNILTGVILTLALVLSMPTLGATAIGSFTEDATSNNGATEENRLMTDDIVVKVNGTHVSTHMMLAYTVMYYGDRPIDLTVVRGAELEFNDKGELTGYSGGERVKLTGVEFPKEYFEDYGGVVYGSTDFRVYPVEKNAWVVITQSLEYSRMMIKTIWDSLYDLVRGRYGVEALSGPVGISEEIGSAAKAGSSSLLYVIVLLSINLGIMNLLPIPALDGGHLVFYIIELIRRKPVKASIRAKINTVALLIIFGLAIIIMLKDIIKLIL